MSGHSSTKGGESGNESDDEELEDDDDDEQSSPVKEGEDNEDEDFQKLIQTLQDVIDDNSKSTNTHVKEIKQLLLVKCDIIVTSCPMGGHLLCWCLQNLTS